MKKTFLYQDQCIIYQSTHFSNNRYFNEKHLDYRQFIMQ